MASVWIQSPCTTYNDNYDELKGNVKKGIEPSLWDVPDSHDPSDRAAAYSLLQEGGVPVGVIYNDETRPTLDQRVESTWEKARPKTVQELMDTFQF